MNDIDIQIEWQEGSGESVEIGYLNPNCQQCCGLCGIPGPIMGSMRTRPSVPSVAMCMEQMELTCTKGDVPNVRKGLRGSSTGGFPNR